MRRLSELMSLSGRVALITGGAGHLGRAFAGALLELGARVVLADMDADGCAGAARDLRDRYHSEVIDMPLDLGVDEQIDQCVENIRRRLGRLDILINNAAFVGDSDLKGWTVPFAEQLPDTWRRALDVNLTSAFVLIQRAAPLLKTEGRGSIINIGSTYGVCGPDMRLYTDTEMGNPAAYAASKGGLIQLTRWLATVLAPEIRVNAVSPGGVWRRQPEQFVEKYVARTPLQRMAREEDLIGIIAYLASDLSAYVTGQNILVDGGWSVW